MNPTKSLVTGAVALSAFASVLGIAYAQVDSTDPATTNQQVQTQSTDQAIPAEQSMQQSDPANANPQSQTYSEAQSQQSTPSNNQQWNQDATSTQQEPLPTDPTAAGTPEPRADRN